MNVHSQPGECRPGREKGARAKEVRIRSAIGSLIILCLLGAGIAPGEETDRIKTLTVKEATRLAQQKSGRLLLNGLKTISPEVAKALAQHKGWLSLNGLTTISDEAAAALGPHKHALHLDGLTRFLPQRLQRWPRIEASCRSMA